MTTGPGPIGDSRESIYEVATEDRLPGAGLRETQDTAGVLERYVRL